MDNKYNSIDGLLHQQSLYFRQVRSENMSRQGRNLSKVMANTYTQIHIQAVFTVQNRECIISDRWNGIIQNNHHKLISINGMPDHIHILFGLRPNQSLSDLLQDIKGSSSKWINERKFVKGKFSWQEGFGAFSYSKSEISKIADYIDSQKMHHSRKTFSEEYIEMLNEFGVEYDCRYIFTPVDIDYIVPDGTLKG
jgi:REP element-mobilizing transposase RayT